MGLTVLSTTPARAAGAVIQLIIVWITISVADAGSYRDSAHGNAGYGVNRSSLDSRYADYATGNCAHCHEMHASLDGTDPLPTGGPAPHALFAEGFNVNRLLGPYLETDNFCFACHSETSGQMVRNQDYSTTFGGGTTGSGPQSILTAFNQTSYHNLYDIKIFLDNSLTYGSWFALRDNPCSACHDSHRARRNWDSAQPGFPLISAISRPGTNVLWGETQVMADHLGYEAPYAIAENREPAGVGLQDGANTPDYVTFCTSCHNADNDIWSTTLNRNLKRINWQNTGLNQNKHGKLARDGAVSLRPPYASAAAIKSDFVLSCLDCHEPHGSVNIMLIRSRINGENLEGVVESTLTETKGYACRGCHLDDLAAGVSNNKTNTWEYVHHLVQGAPYVKTSCANCHASGGGKHIDCSNCHGHGLDDSWLPVEFRSGRTTF